MGWCISQGSQEKQNQQRAGREISNVETNPQICSQQAGEPMVWFHFNPQEA